METRKDSNVFMVFIKIGLIAYTMIRTVDLVMSTMPPEIKTFGVLAVCGMDLALLAWDNYTANPYKARCKAQHNVGVLMIVANMLGIGAAMVADSARVMDGSGYSSLVSTVGIFVISGVVLGNVAGLIAVNQMDPDRAEEQAAAEHARNIKKLQADHDRRMQADNIKTELDVAAYKNAESVKKARQRFYLPDMDNNGTSDIVDAANRGDITSLKRQLQEALDSIERSTTHTKNGHGVQTMATLGEDRPDPKA